MEKYTCIRFPLRSEQEDYLRIISGGGCYSSLGKIGGRQIISLNKNGCLSRGTIQHEIIHALGYDHMQNHADRDKYITINHRNIVQSTMKNFEKTKTSQYSNFGTPYDYWSVMHYNPYAFAINRDVRTITTKDPKYADVIGQRKSVSYEDVRRINRMYECKNVQYI